jgi:hypothetical protein
MLEIDGIMLPPMKLRNTILMATLGLIMSALTAQAAPIQITSLPFNITAPALMFLEGI